MADPKKFGELFTRWSDAWKAADETRTLTILAAEIGVDNSLVSHWRSGRTTPDARTPAMSAMCRVLGLSTEDARDAYRLCGVDLGPALGSEAHRLGA